MKKEREEKGKRVKAVKVKNCKRLYSSLAMKEKRISKAKLTERFENRQIQRDKEKKRKTKNDEEEREERER